METRQHKYKSSPRPVYCKSYGSIINVTDRIVTGYLASFNNMDSDGDIILKGAFAKSIAERGPDSSTNRKIAYLWQHQMKEPLGKFLVLKEDDIGLYFEAELDKIPLSERAKVQYESGTLNQHSIGFKYVWDKTVYDETLDAFLLKEINLFEGSVVTLASNENTPFLGMKGFDLATEAEILSRETEKFLKSLPYDQEYEARQLLSKYVALLETEPDQKTIRTAKEELFDISAAIKGCKLF